MFPSGALACRTIWQSTPTCPFNRAVHVTNSKDKHETEKQTSHSRHPTGWRKAQGHNNTGENLARQGSGIKCLHAEAGIQRAAFNQAGRVGAGALRAGNDGLARCFLQRRTFPRVCGEQGATLRLTRAGMSRETRHQCQHSRSTRPFTLRTAINKHEIHNQDRPARPAVHPQPGARNGCSRSGNAGCSLPHRTFPRCAVGREPRISEGGKLKVALPILGNSTNNATKKGKHENKHEHDRRP